MNKNCVCIKEVKAANVRSLGQLEQQFPGRQPSQMVLNYFAIQK